MKLIQPGIEDFKELIDINAYYMDKTSFIEEVLKEKVVIYTRPRRFGKTLNMSMLYYFFSNKEKENAYLFDGLNISHNEEAMKHQNQYPVIFLSLKEMVNLSFDRQIASFSNIIYELLDNLIELLESDQLTDVTKKKLNSLHKETASIEDLSTSLRIISQAMYTHYHQKVIIIIDEYDGTNVIKEDSYDFFVIGEPYFKKLCRLHDRVMCYFAIWLITFFWLKTI